MNEIYNLSMQGILIIKLLLKLTPEGLWNQNRITVNSDIEKSVREYLL